MQKPTPSTPIPDPLPILDAARLVPCHPDTIRRQVAAGKLSSARSGIGGNARILVSRSEVEKFAASVRHGAPS